MVPKKTTQTVDKQAQIKSILSRTDIDEKAKMQEIQTLLAA